MNEVPHAIDDKDPAETEHFHTFGPRVSYCLPKYFDFFLLP